MAKTPDDETKRPKSKAKEAAVWVMMGLLILGLGGFGVTSFSGGVTRVASVGEIDITADDYARALQTQVRRFSQQVGQPVSTQEALAFGIDRQVVEGLVARAALDNETQRIGLSAGDEVVATEIIAMPAFQGIDGQFDREAYRFQLEGSNQSEAEFEASLRRDVARELLQGAVASGFTAPDALVDTINAFIGERRGFSLLRLTEADLTAPIPEPTDADLQAHYDAQIDRFTRPEARRITYVALLPEDLAASQPVDEALLRQMYDDRLAEFVLPERRIVERLVYPDQAAADAARAQLDAGTPFETLVSERGLTLDAIGMGDVAREDLGAAADGVFAAGEGAVAGPLPSDLGPALYRVVSVLAADETTFEEARDLLALEIQTDAARRAISDKVELVDDLLAGGATLEELVTEAEMQLGTVDFVPGAQGSVAIEGYPAFRAAAEAVQEGDFPEAILLEDGGLVALRLDAIVPATPIPFAEARDAVAADWRADALSTALSARAVEIKTQIEGGAAIGTFGIVDVTSDIARDGFVANAPDTLLPSVFALNEGDVQVIDGPGFVGVVRLDRIRPADTEGDEAQALRDALAAQATQAIASDAFTAYTNALADEAGIVIDQTVLNGIHASLP
jgi:peptidyl-prolyl cis-trans isomerase D